jgi:hypothetical protein
LWARGIEAEVGDLASLAQVDEAQGVALDFLFSKNEAIFGWIPRNSFVFAVFEDAGGVFEFALLALAALGLEDAELIERLLELAGEALAILASFRFEPSGVRKRLRSDGPCAVKCSVHWARCPAQTSLLCGRLLPSAVRRLDLPRRDFVLEVVGIETVKPAVARFGLRVHEEANRRTGRSGQRDVVREVVRHPIHLPRPE